MWMSRVTHMYQSCLTQEYAVSHVWMSHVTHIWISHVTHMNESRHTEALAPSADPWSERVMSHTWIHFITCMNESCYTHEYTLSRVWMSHVAHMNTLYHVYEWVMLHTWIHCITRMDESRHTHMNESCHTYEWVTSHRCFSALRRPMVRQPGTPLCAPGVSVSVSVCVFVCVCVWQPGTPLCASGVCVCVCVQCVAACGSVLQCVAGHPRSPLRTLGITRINAPRTQAPRTQRDAWFRKLNESSKCHERNVTKLHELIESRCHTLNLPESLSLSLYKATWMCPLCTSSLPRIRRCC